MALGPWSGHVLPPARMAIFIFVRGRTNGQDQERVEFEDMGNILASGQAPTTEINTSGWSKFLWGLGGIVLTMSVLLPILFIFIRPRPAGQDEERPILEDRFGNLFDNMSHRAVGAQLAAPAQRRQVVIQIEAVDLLNNEENPQEEDYNDDFTFYVTMEEE